MLARMYVALVLDNFNVRYILNLFHEVQIKAFYYKPLHFFKKGTLTKFTLEIFTS